MIKLFLIILFSLLSGNLLSQNQRTEHWQNRNQQFIREMSEPGTGNIVFLGNSITEGFDLQGYFPGVPAVNRGISGDHIDGLLERFDNSVRALRPAKLSVLIGINDIGRGDTDHLILARYTSLLDSISILPDSTEIYLTSILPTSSRWTNCPPGKIVRLNYAIEQLAGKYRMNWINLYPLFASKDNYLKPELTSDGLHLNQAGYEIWVDELNKTGIFK